MSVWYNENDKFKAEWLRQLIGQGVIARGVVDERPIQQVQPADLDGFVQCHFFAGVGVWSFALRRAGWPDDRPIWTGSCPCTPFSLAGKQEGFGDPRHLWPEWFRLIRQCRPDCIAGEQVSTANAWLDLVQSDLEGDGYAVGAVDLPAAGFGGAHIRQRFYWVADRNDPEWWAERAPWNDGHWPTLGRFEGDGDLEACRLPGWVADNSRRRLVKYSERDGGAFRVGEGVSLGNNASGRGDLQRVARGQGDGRGQERPDAGGGAPGDDPQRFSAGYDSCAAAVRLGDPSLNRSPADAGDYGEVRGLPEAERESELGPTIHRRSGATGGVGDGERFNSWRDSGTGPASEAGPQVRPVGDHDGPSSGSGGLDNNLRLGWDGSEAGGQQAGWRQPADAGCDYWLGSPSQWGPSDAHYGFIRRSGRVVEGREALQPGDPSRPGFDWLFCRDGKWRPVESTASPLVNATTARVVRLRGYGDALDAETAAQFIAAYIEAKDAYRMD